MKYDLLRAVNNGVNIQEMDLRVVDYARVSTASREQRKSFENQLDTYRQMIEENSHWTYAGTYSDEAVTGTKAHLRGGNAVVGMSLSVTPAATNNVFVIVTGTAVKLKDKT